MKKKNTTENKQSARKVASYKIQISRSEPCAQLQKKNTTQAQSISGIISKPKKRYLQKFKGTFSKDPRTERGKKRKQKFSSNERGKASAIWQRKELFRER